MGDIKKGFLKKGNILFRIMIPVVFFGFVFRIIPPSDIKAAFLRTDWCWFGVGCVCVLVTNYLSSIRTRHLLFERSQSLVTLWHIHALRSFVAGALPFSTGELSYVYYLKKYCVAPAAKSMAILVSVRFIEYTLFIGILFILATSGIFKTASPVNLAALGVISLNLLLICLTVWKSSLIISVLEKVLNRLFGRFSGKAIFQEVAGKVDQFYQAAQQVFKIENRQWLIGITLIIVLIRNFFTLSMLRAMGVGINIWMIVFLFIFLFATRFFQGFGSFGSQETGIAGALMIMDYNKEEALAIAIGTHILQWIPVLVLGSVSYLGLRKSTHETDGD